MRWHRKLTCSRAGMRVVTQDLAGATWNRDVGAAKAIAETARDASPQSTACDTPPAAAHPSHTAAASRNRNCRSGLGAAKSPVQSQLPGIEALG